MVKIPDNILVALYGAGALDIQQQRYGSLVREYSEHFGTPKLLQFVSAPGRTELGGNHTDHNCGKVLCAAVRLDTVAVFELRSDHRIQLKSSTFQDLIEVDLSSLGSRDEENGTSSALIRGIAAGVKMKGFQTGGFNAVVYSDVGIGSGLSSSASFEVVIGSIINTIYNEGGMDQVTIAKIGQYAENVYFGKPCGLMDQLVCAVGGVLSIDFKDNDHPVVQKIPADFDRMDCILAVVNTGGSHADLTPAYASIPEEMRHVASLFGKSALREVREEELRANLSLVRKNAGDRAVLRALHFFNENRRVEKMVDALEAGDFEAYLGFVAESGESSVGMLQNTVAPGSTGQAQPAALALGVSNDFFRSRGRGVARIHGGGFAGTIQVYVPRDHFEEYTKIMAELFGDGCVQTLATRKQGVVGSGYDCL